MPRIGSQKRHFSRVVSDLRNCVFSVIRHRTQPDGQNGAMPLGSGFFVSPNVFFTCNHVMNGPSARHEPADRYQLVNNLGAQGTVIDFADAELGRNIHLYPEKDAAILQVAGTPPQQQYVFLDFGNTPEGMDIGVAGYPLPQLGVENGVLQYHGLIYRVARGTVTSAFKQNIQNAGEPLIRDVDTVEVNFLFVSGNSGGPIFDAETGRVYAFVHGFRAAKIQENYTDTAQTNVAQGAPGRHIESMHAIYSVGIRLTNARAELQARGVAL